MTGRVNGRLLAVDVIHVLIVPTLFPFIHRKSGKRLIDDLVLKQKKSTIYSANRVKGLRSWQDPIEA